MFTQEEDVEAFALRKRGWTIAAIARHLGRDRKTVRGYLNGDRQPGQRASSGPNGFAPYAEYVHARLREDPHVWATALYDEIRRLGFDRSYPRFTAALRRGQLRPHCEACAGVKGRPTIEIPHPPGEEAQWDWLELPGGPWGGEAHLLMGTLAFSGKSRGVFAESEDQAHLVDAIDGVLRRWGGTPRRWRFDRMATVVTPLTDRLARSFATVAKYYGVAVDVCPPRRANRKGAVEKQNHYSTQRWWRTAAVRTLETAQLAFDRFQETTGDARRRRGTTVAELAKQEPLQALPPTPFPATLEVQRIVGDSALVAVRGNRYRVPPGLVGTSVTVRHRLGSNVLEVVSAAGLPLSSHRLEPAGAGAIVQTAEQQQALEQIVLQSFTTRPPCQRKANRPPGAAALAAAARLRPSDGDEVAIDLDRYAVLLESTR